MSNINAEHIWIEAGYEIFIAEGLEGIHVERLARITRLNKSGYYHYFGDMETYLEKLMDHHLRYVVAYSNELKQILHFDPEYIELLIKYSKQLLFTNQLIKNRQNKLCFKTQELINEKIDPIVSKLFADFIGFQNHREFSAKYFNQVRYMLHAQLTPIMMNYPALRDFMYEARDVIQSAAKLKTFTK
jgi:AcrR family transcriptional regulator